MALEHVTRLTCVRCGRHHSLDVDYTCPSCGLEGVLDIEYDYDRVGATLTHEALQGRARNHWRYMELLPLEAAGALPTLQVGMTPVYDAPRLAHELGVRELLLKDDGRNPTGSFKDRASAVGVLKALERGQRTIACASTGNAASSLAGFSAAMGLRSFIFVPERAPEPKLAQLLIFGAHVLRVRGNYDETWMLCQRACERHGWYNRNCAINPYLVEGKKTAGLELGEQLGEKVVDWVVVSVGDGCTLSGLWKGLKEMHRLGFIPRLPRMLGVQAVGSAPVAEAHARQDGELRPVQPQTLADSIAVGHPRNWRKALRALQESLGAMVCVEDEEILEAMRKTARLAAVFAEPAAAAATAGLGRAVAQGLIGHHERVLLMMTGNGLKDIRGALQAVPSPMEVPADLGALEETLRARRLL